MVNDTRLINVMMSEDLIRKVDDYRFENRFESRAEAIRFLVEWALNKGAKPERRV